MSLFITSLNSGSNGNAYYVGNHEEGILIDAGISCREIERRMTRLDLPMARLRAIFVSHEHSDHIQGVAVTAKKYRLPVYITADTLKQSRLPIENQLIVPFKPLEAVQVGALSISAFSKRHDACDPYSFMVRSAAVNVGIFTDIGSVCPELVRHFRECHAAFLEANYDEEMLAQGRYPAYLKSRIRGGMGHLSNRQALDLFLEHRSYYMSRLILSHLSEENNDPALVMDLFQKHAGAVEVVVASRHKETPVFEVRADADVLSKENKPCFTRSQLQLSLFQDIFPAGVQ
ncbi:MAG: MBL fold metallo-hydrolase [Chitinophagaceae bacterium]|nr:MBL fold metallo-hydrolase [Chitinophagaceae bacterium]